MHGESQLHYTLRCICKGDASSQVMKHQRRTLDDWVSSHAIKLCLPFSNKGEYVIKNYNDYYRRPEPQWFVNLWYLHDLVLFIQASEARVTLPLLLLEGKPQSVNFWYALIINLWNQYLLDLRESTCLFVPPCMKESLHIKVHLDIRQFNFAYAYFLISNNSDRFSKSVARIVWIARGPTLYSTLLDKVNSNKLHWYTRAWNE